MGVAHKMEQSFDCNIFCHHIQQELAFKPSMGVEFVTQMGIYFPKFMDTGIRMHTNIYHESGLDSKVTMSGNQVKLSIPVTKQNTQLLSIR